MYCLHHDEDVLEERVPCPLCGLGESTLNARTAVGLQVRDARDSRDALQALTLLQDAPSDDGLDEPAPPRSSPSLHRPFW